MANVISGWILQQLRDQEVRHLYNLSSDELKSLWDRYDGVNEPGGFTGESIHMALNMKGLGHYCAV